MGKHLGPKAITEASRLIEAGVTECIPWAGRVDRDGFARYSQETAYRVLYRLFCGEIPDGSDLDHRCHEPSSCAGGVTCPHRRCVNPTHLEPATRAENTLRGLAPAAINARKTHCIRGHEFNEQNTYRRKHYRICRACTAMHQRAYKARKRAAA